MYKSIACGIAWLMIFAFDTGAADTLALVGGQLIDGTGTAPVSRSTVVIDNGIITAAGPQDQVPIPAHARRIDTSGKTVMPGLINLHVHFSSVGHNDYARWDKEYPADRIRKEILPATAQALLRSGVTSARDLGADIENAFWLRDQERSGKLPAPHVFIAGPPLCTPGRQSSSPVTASSKYWIVKSPEDGRAKVKELARRGVDVIKLWDDNFTVQDFTAMIGEAHANKLHVAAHLLTVTGVENALAGGMGAQDTLDHVGGGPGAIFSEDTVQKIVTRKVYLSPTLIAFEGLRQLTENPKLLDDPAVNSGLPASLYEDVRESFRGKDPKKNPIYEYVFVLNRDRTAKLRQLYRAGGIFALGTDSGSRANPHHLSAWREMVLMVQEIGMTNMQVIEAATRIPAGVIGQSKRRGTIEVGKSADVIVVNGNPLAQMSDMRLVERVFKDGVPVDLN